MAGAAIPAVIGAAGSIGSALIGSRRSGAEKQALAGQQASASQLMSQGQSLFGAGMPAMRSALSYYDTLLNGNRAAQAQAIAAPTANITDMYRGAERNLERTGVRGGVKDLAMAELGRDRTSKLAQLTTGVQPMAAGALGSLGGQAAGMATGATSAAGGQYSTILGQQFQNRQNTNAMFGQAADNTGEMIYQVWKNKQGKGGAGVGP